MVFEYNFSSIIPADSTIALGDIHAQYDLFVQFLDWVKDSGARVILLGDLVDRANIPGDDLRVLERVYDLVQDPESWGLESFTSVIGNHESLLMDASDGYSMMDWVRNGGDIQNLDALAKHVPWIRELPYYVTVGDTLFSHAGCYPGSNPAESMDSFARRERFVWNRGPFLDWGPEFGKWSNTFKRCVFGHTPDGPLPYRIPNGVCIDTKAFDTGVLTAYNSTYDIFHSFTRE